LGSRVEVRRGKERLHLKVFIDNTRDQLRWPTVPTYHIGTYFNSTFFNIILITYIARSSGRLPPTSELLQYTSPDGSVQFPRHASFTRCVTTTSTNLSVNVVYTRHACLVARSTAAGLRYAYCFRSGVQGHQSITRLLPFQNTMAGCTTTREALLSIVPNAGQTLNSMSLSIKICPAHAPTRPSSRGLMNASAELSEHGIEYLDTA
jgi:hypothetical protein